MSPFSRASFYLQRIHSAVAEQGSARIVPQTVTSTCDATHLASLVPGFDRLDLQAHRLAFLTENPRDPMRLPGEVSSPERSAVWREKRHLMQTLKWEEEKGGLVWKGAVGLPLPLQVWCLINEGVAR